MMRLFSILIISLLGFPFFAFSIETIENQVEELVPIIPEGATPEEAEQINQDAWFDLQYELREDRRYREELRERQRAKDLREVRLREQREQEKRREEERRQFQREQERERAEELRRERRRMEQRRIDDQMRRRNKR